MINPHTLLFSLALCCVAAAPSQGAPLRPASSPDALTAGRRYVLPRGSFIAVNQAALSQFFAASRRHDQAAVLGLIRRNEVQKLICDAEVVVARAPGPSDPGVEVQIPGFIGTVVAQRPNLTAR